MSGPVSLPDLELGLAELPLFPLPHVVLFPGAFLPLHVFEPRYVALVRHILSRHRSLSVVQELDGAQARKPGAAAEREGESAGVELPPIARIAGAGTIVDYEEVPGGRYDIVVLGRARVELVELAFVAPFRRARARVIDTDDDERVPPAHLTALHAAAQAFARSLPDPPAGRGRGRGSRALKAASPPAGIAPGALADAYAAALVLDGRDRQAVLEAVGARARVERVTEILTAQRMALATPSGGGGALN